MAMITKTATAKAENAYGKPLTSYKDKEGKPLPSFINYTYSWHEYADDETMVEAHDQLTLEEQRKVRNVERKTKARQAANTAALELAGIVKPNAENDVLVRLKLVYAGVYAGNIASGMTVEAATEAARKTAAEVLGVDWPSDDDE